ncbi:MAG: hypothetical protein QOC63_502, partial [Mycobacterium sp.]|nr:hypothetical protein [Mycobacterium sp.]
HTTNPDHTYSDRDHGDDSYHDGAYADSSTYADGDGADGDCFEDAYADGAYADRDDGDGDYGDGDNGDDDDARVDGAYADSAHTDSAYGDTGTSTASDRFVSVKKTPKNPTGEHDPHSNKTVVVVGSDCWEVIGYSGLAYLNGRPTDQLIAEVLSGREDLSSAGIGGWYQPNLHYREIRDRIEAAICDAYMRLSLEEQKYSTSVLTAGVQRKGEGIQHVMFTVEVSQNGSRCTEFTNAHRRELLMRPWFNRFHVDAVGTRIGWLGALTALRLSLYTRVARPPTTSAEKFREGFRDILMDEVAATAILSGCRQGCNGRHS